MDVLIDPSPLISKNRSCESYISNNPKSSPLTTQCNPNPNHSRFGTFHRLHEASIVNGSFDSVEDLLIELLLTCSQHYVL